jgi:hypothetical protein
MTTTIQRGEMMGPWMLSSEGCLFSCSVFLLSWLMSDDENFSLPNSEDDEPCLSK